MKTYSTPLIFSLLLSTISLGVAYILAGYGQVLSIFFVLSIVLIAGRRISKFWATSFLLAVFMVLASIGIILGLSPALLIFGGTAALASWEMILHKDRMQVSAATQREVTIEDHHIKTLGFASFAGISLAMISFVISLKLPFWFVLIVVAMAFVGIWRGLDKR